MPRQIVISLEQFRLLKGKRRQSVAVQFTPAQWKRALKGIKFTPGKPPEKFKGVRLVETPGIGGGFAMPECPSPCQFRFQDGKFKCACTAQDDFNPGGSGGGGFFQFCAMSIGANGAIRCLGQCAQAGRTCSPSAWRIPFARVVLISCGCHRP
jgi:hypothetical protein